ncbi:MAG: OsmC family protein [Candidatus Poseidoniales archaeon]|jgi:putative redox protein
MQGRVEWTGGSSAVGTTASGQELEYDWDNGPSPMQVALQMVGACALADVVIGLKERPFTRAWVELDSTRASEAPRRFLSITMVFHVVGEVPVKLLDRVVDKTLEKYCSVSSSLNPDIPIDFKVVVHEPSEA